jgi:hypothetical protein
VLKALALKLMVLIVNSLSLSLAGRRQGFPRPCAALFSPSPALKPPLFSGGGFFREVLAKAACIERPGKT